MKKKQTPPIEDPKQLNAAFLLKFAKLNYQAKNINVEMLNPFSNFLQYLSQSLTKQPQNYSQQIIKALIDIAITVEFNLHMTEQFLSQQIQPVLKFLQTLFNFIEKVFTYEQKPNKDKAIQVIDLFWPLLKNQKQIEKVEVKHFDKIALVLQKIPNLPYIYEIEPHTLRISPDAVLNEAVEISYLNQKIDFSIIFRAALSKYNEKNKIFIESFLSFFEYSMNDSTNSKQNRTLFEKCLNVLMNISNSIGQKYNYIQIFFNRIIKSSNFIRNFVYALSSSLNNNCQSDLRIEKYYSNDHLLSLSFIILEKIITFRYMTKEMFEALQIIAKFSENWVDIDEQTFTTNDFSNKINSEFLLKIIKFLTIVDKGPIVPQVSSLSQIFEASSSIQSQKSLFQSEQIDQKRLYEFIKQCNKIRTQSQDGQQQMQMVTSSKLPTNKKEDSTKNTIQIGIIKNMSKILQNLSKNKHIVQKLKFTSAQKLQEIIIYCYEGQNQNRTQQQTVLKQLSQLLIKCFPHLIPDQWIENLLRKFLFQNKQTCTIKSEKGLQVTQVLIIKKLETQVFTKIKQYLSFQEFMLNSFNTNNFEQQNILNFHFLIFFIYLKKCSNLPEKQEFNEIQFITSTVISKLNQLLQSYSILRKQNKNQVLQKLNKKLLILEFFLILILDHPSGSFKLGLKKIFSNDIFKVGKSLDLYELISLNQKQSVNNFFNCRLKQILGQNRSQDSLTNKFLTFVDKLNLIGFPSNYLHLTAETKEQKNLKIFFNIKMNGIALSLDRSHRIPVLIQNINTMKKVNSINNELQILLFSFGEYFNEIQQDKNKIQVQGQNKQQSIEQSVIIVAFNYLLKINIQMGKFNQRNIDQSQNDVRQQIQTLKVIHISIQQTLQKIQKLILLQNPPFNLKTLIKLLKNIKQSINSSGITQKYTELINQGQIIKLISQLTQDSQKLKIQFSQLALITIKKILLKDQKILNRIQQLQKVKLQHQNNQSLNIQMDQQQIVKEENKIIPITDLSPKLKQLHLLYYPYKYDLSLSNLLKVRIESAILQLLDDSTQTNQPNIQNIYKSIVQDLLKNITHLKEIIIKQNQTISLQAKLQIPWNFQYQNNHKFITYIIKSILKMFSADLPQSSVQLNDKIFAISAELLDSQEICKLARKQIGQDLNLQLVNMISQRVNQGFMILQKSLEVISPRKSKKMINQVEEVQNKQIKDFLSTSLKLYTVLKKVINFQSVNSQQIINCLIQKDQLTSPQVTKFLLQQLLNLSSFIKTKSDSITQTIFNYILKVNASYNTGKQKLQIPEFICEFFNISHTQKSINQIKSLEKSQKANNVCSPNPSYRCMKCDDKRLICYSCMIECHKGHPVLYLAEQKFPKCQCRQTNDDCCKLVKKGEQGKQFRNPPINNIFNYERRQTIRPAKHEFFMGDQDRVYEPLNVYEQEEQYNQINRFGGTKIRKARDFDALDKQSIFAMDPTYQRIENPLAFGGPQLVRQEKKIQEIHKFTEQNFEFQDQVYESTQNKMQIQKISNTLNQTEIVSQSYLLPVFLQMFNQIYGGNQQVSSHKINYQMEKFGFDSLNVGKVMHASWRATNAGSYNVRLRKDNPLNNRSPAVAKQVIAQNQKFIIIASGNMLYVHLKQKYMQQLLQCKSGQIFQSVNQFTGNFDIHTVDFSPVDEFSFVISGLHTIILMQVTGDGMISRNNSQQLRVNVNNDYVNKVRTSSLGIFYGTSYQIKLLNWSFKPILTIKSSAECLLKDWCLYEKRTGCTVYCVTAHGHTEFIDVTASDQGKKFFTGKVNDGRKTIQTGASILVKDADKIGKVYIGSFKDKDGTNIIANLVGDTTQNSSFFTLRNNFLDILGKKYLIGQSQIVKGGQNQIFVVCTIRQPLTPDISNQQGQLVVFRVKKDKKCEFSLINTDNKCESFCVIPIGDNNWSVVSMHDDGSLHFSVFQKPQKLSIDQQCKKLREIQPVNNDKNNEKYSKIKESIKKSISADLLQNIQLEPLNYFRQFSDPLKTNVDIKVNKKKEDYQITLLNTNKVITGFTLPFVGNVYFLHRTVKSTVQVGLSNLEILHFFSEGTLKFRVEKIQDYKSGMDNLNQKFRQKLQRLERLNEMAMDSQRATQLINTIKQAESINDQVDFYGLSIDSFKNRIQNFSQIFNQQSNMESKDKNVQKMGILLKIFIEYSIREQNYLCQPQQILEFVKNLRKISLTVTKIQTYRIIKDLIVSALKMFESMNQIKSHVFNDQFYPLKYATEEKVQDCYQMLKGQISDNQVESIIASFCDIVDDDLSLGLLYLAKYPSLLAKIQKKNKKIDKIDVSANKLLKLYVLGYQVLKYKNHNCQWILGAICSIFGAQTRSKPLRQSFYETLSKYANVKLEAWLRNVPQIDGQQNVSDVHIITKPPPVPQQNLAAQNSMASLYSQFNMGEMDQQAMLRMAIEMSEMQFKQKQQDNFNGPNLIQQEKENFVDEALMMEDQIVDIKLDQQKKRTFLMDLVQHCTLKLNETTEFTVPKIIVLYVISKYINATENQSAFCQILNRIIKTLGQLSVNCDNFDKHILMTYFSVFSNILSTSTILKNKSSEQADELYLVIKQQVLDRLESVKPQKVHKLKNPPNLLGKIFRGEKVYTFAHYSYGLVSLLLPPCQPLPILLSLQCYWLLPESKQYYTKMKHMTTIKEGISTGNIDKIYEVSNIYPDIWRESADIPWLQGWIEDRKTNWERALSLLALYYQNDRTECNQ